MECWIASFLLWKMVLPFDGMIGHSRESAVFGCLIFVFLESAKNYSYRHEKNALPMILCLNCEGIALPARQSL